jgi:large subunit ribosomal protein L22
MAQANASVRMVRVTPRKARYVADLIRGRKVAEARDILLFTPRAASPIIRKVLESAVANAENAAAEKRERIDTDEMVVSEILVNEGTTIKRFRPRARGRATSIRKRTSHISLIISD